MFLTRSVTVVPTGPLHFSLQPSAFSIVLSGGLRPDEVRPFAVKSLARLEAVLAAATFSHQGRQPAQTCENQRSGFRYGQGYALKG
jgi:hypothetical protein